MLYKINKLQHEPGKLTSDYGIKIKRNRTVEWQCKVTEIKTQEIYNTWQTLI